MNTIESPLPIVHVVADGSPGGGTTVVLELATAQLAAYGRGVHFLSEAGSYALDQAKSRGLQASGFEFMSSRFDRRTGRALDQVLERLNPRIVHLHGARAAFTALRGAFARSGKAKLVYTVHGYHFAHKPPGLRHLAALAERYVCAHVDATVFVSRHDQRLACRWRLVSDHDRTQVIYNGLCFEAMPPPRADKRFDLCFLGRLHEPKNPLFLVGLLRGLDQPKGYSLAIVGGGELEATLRRRLDADGLSGGVTYFGALPRVDALRVLARARILVLPSLWEGLPTAAIEAMYLGVPVVASSTGGTPEVVEHGITGVLVDRFDPSSYREAIDSLLERREVYDRMSAASCARASEMFDHRRTFAAYERLYLAALKQ